MTPLTKNNSKPAIISELKPPDHLGGVYAAGGVLYSTRRKSVRHLHSGKARTGALVRVAEPRSIHLAGISSIRNTVGNMATLW